MRKVKYLALLKYLTLLLEDNQSFVPPKICQGTRFCPCNY